MLKVLPKINEEYFGSFPREAMRVLIYMTENWPKKRTFNTEELGNVVDLKGKVLGGVLGTFSKRAELPLVVKVGTITVGWEGQKFERPKQVWALNPRLTSNDIDEIINILNHFMLVSKIDEFENDKYYYRLTFFPGDNVYVITKLKKSNIVVRGQRIRAFHEKEIALHVFKNMKSKGGE
ncbi:MAG: hypothetical protein WCW66_06010 [Patescibacteria group bacterium]